VYLDNHAITGRFSRPDLELLQVFAHQSAATIENARLFSSLREAHARMRMIFDSVASGVITTDIEGRITSFNPAAERIFGFSAQEALGAAHQVPLQTEEPSVLGDSIERVLRTGEQMAGVEVACVLPRRGEAWLNVSLSPLRSETGETTGSALVVHD